MLYLDSVGSFVDIVTKLVYPALENGTTENLEWCATPISEVTEEWLAGLDERDMKNLKSFNLI